MSKQKTVKIPASKPRNPYTVGVRTRSGAGAHKDKKRESKNTHEK
jgi:hypothetical protein